jgi:hypothetical protein
MSAFPVVWVPNVGFLLASAVYDNSLGQSCVRLFVKDRQHNYSENLEFTNMGQSEHHKAGLKSSRGQLCSSNIPKTWTRTSENISRTAHAGTRAF